MAEKMSSSDAEYDAKDSRRTWLKNILGAGAAVGLGLTAESCSPEKNREQLVNEMIHGKTEKVIVEDHQTLWGLHEKSGYSDVGNDTFVEAVHNLNPDYNFGKDGNTLQPNTELVIPVKEK